MNELERRRIRNSIVDPDPYVEKVLRDIDAKTNRTLYGPDGVTPILEPIVDDRTLTYSKGGESFSQDPEAFLMSVGRMARDGWGIDRIRAELDLPRELVSDTVLDRAMRFAAGLLESAVAEGAEPEESVRVIGYKDPSVVDEDVNEATQADVESLAERVVEEWKQ